MKPPMNGQKFSDLQVFGSQHEFGEHILINGDEILVPLISFFSRGIRKIATVMLAVQQNLHARVGVTSEFVRKDMRLTFSKTLDETFGSGIVYWSVFLPKSQLKFSKSDGVYMIE